MSGEALSDAALARRKLELEVAERHKELGKMDVDIEKLRADMRQDARRTLYQGIWLLVTGMAVGAALLTAAIALSRAFF